MPVVHVVQGNRSIELRHICLSCTSRFSSVPDAVAAKAKAFSTIFSTFSRVLASISSYSGSSRTYLNTIEGRGVDLNSASTSAETGDFVEAATTTSSCIILAVGMIFLCGGGVSLRAISATILAVPSGSIRSFSVRLGLEM